MYSIVDLYITTLLDNMRRSRYVIKYVLIVSDTHAHEGVQECRLHNYLQDGWWED